QAVNALLRAAQTFEQMAQLGEASRVLEKLAVADSKSARRWKELAADFHTLNGDTAAARKQEHDLKVRADANQKLALMNKLEALEKNYGTDQTHNEVVRQLIDQGVAPFADQSKVKLVERQYENGHDTDAFNEAKRFLGTSMAANEKAHLRLVQA